MCPMTLTTSQSSSLLDNWYEAIRLNLPEQATKLKDIVDGQLNQYRNNPASMLHYTLMEYRYYTMIHDRRAADEAIEKVHPFKNELATQLAYYYHFFQGVYYAQFGLYQEALECFTEARPLINDLSDQMELAEYFYRLASVYYNMRKSLLSIHYGNQAKELFRPNPQFHTKWGDCENLLGVNCITLKQYEEAEEHLHAALDLAKETNDHELILLVKYNLGYLYSEQNLTPIALKQLEELYAKEFYFPKTLFLYSRELMRAGEKVKANRIIEEGIEFCKMHHHTEYLHHLQLTKAFYSDEPMALTEPVIHDGIEYFKKEELWHFVQEYSDQLGRLFFEKKNHQKASEYFYLGHVAKEKLFLMEALK